MDVKRSEHSIITPIMLVKLPEHRGSSLLRNLKRAYIGSNSQPLAFAKQTGPVDKNVRKRRKENMMGGIRVACSKPKQGAT
jgi:hypothetical protein